MVTNLAPRSAFSWFRGRDRDRPNDLSFLEKGKQGKDDGVHHGREERHDKDQE
jgi:hypothetical protein